jgi:ribonucleotide reductase alpha subunit
MYEKLSQERKDGQAEGTIPDWYTTGGWQMVKGKYLLPGETVKRMYERVAVTAAQHLPYRALWAERFFDIMWKGWLSPATPVLVNMGTNRGMPVSCSGAEIQDDVTDFYTTQAETAALTKHGFGTSADLSKIRPRGAPISTGGTASGVLPVLKDYVQLSRDVSQGNNRRGAWAGYLNIEHGDFWEVADYLFNNPDDLNLGWNIHNSFIKRLDAGDEEAHKRWHRVLKIRAVTGKGYLCKLDTINRLSPSMYKDLGLTVKSSNLCVAPETTILTNHGSMPIADLNNKRVKVWNGSEWSTVTIKKTGANQPLIRVKTDTGHSLDCTPRHKFYIIDDNGDTVKRRAMDLLPGDRLIQPESLPDNQSVVTMTIKAIVDEGRRDDTYCFTERKRHLGVFNGILTGQCDEITLFSDQDHSFTCVLSSMNLSKWDEWEGTNAVFWSTVFLDCVAQEFIERAREIPALHRAVRFTEKGRALGLGVLGFHSLLQQEGIPFGDFQAHLLNNTIFKHLHDESLRASKWMAGHLGEPAWCKGYGVRNTHRTALAPTMSTSVICGGNSQGIEPIVANAYNQNSAVGEIKRVNPQLVEIMKREGVYNDETIRRMVNNVGSVQGEDWLTAYEKLIYLTAHEINQADLIRLAEARQKHICQGQSLNLFFSAEESEEYIARIHQQALKSPVIKGLYYLRSMSNVRASSGECTACHA